MKLKIVDETVSSVAEAPDLQIRGVWNHEGAIVLELKGGRFDCSTKAYQEVKWRAGCYGTVVEGDYFGEWNADGGKVHGRQDCLTHEVRWTIEQPLVGVTAVTSEVVVARIRGEAPMLLIERSSGEVIRELPEAFQDNLSRR